MNISPTRASSILLIISVFISTISFVNKNHGRGELYPFFDWRLFTKPSGAMSRDSLYRLYGRSSGDWVALPYTNSRYFDENDEASAINTDGAALDANPRDTAAYGDMWRFARFCYPGYGTYKIVKETFNPHILDQKEHQSVYQDIQIIQ